MEISMPGVDTQFKFSPFNTILEDGLERIFEVMKNEGFRFSANSKSLVKTLAETVSISPIVHTTL
jgi:hypothetical protein